MEITSALDYSKHRAELNSVIKTLGDIGKAIETGKEKSDIAQTLEVIKILKENEAFRKSLLEIPFPTLAAFYLSRTLAHILKHTLGNFSYEEFIHLQQLAIKENWQACDFKKVKASLLQYVQQKFDPEMAPELAKRMVTWLAFFQSTYVYVKGYAVAYQEDGSLSKNTILDDLEQEFPTDFPNGKQMRHAALLLEHFGIRYQDAPFSLGQLQNALISEGLAFKEGAHPYFCPFGACYTVTEILDYNREALITWYITEKFAGHFERFYSMEEAEAKAAFSNLMRKVYTSLRDFSKTHKHKPGPALLSEFACLLKSLQQRTHTTEQQLKKWLWGLERMMNLLDNGRTLLASQKTTDTIRIMLFGDSITQGFGVTNPAKRWTTIAAEKLKALQIPFELINCSVAGYETTHGLAIIQRELSAHKPDIVFGTLGGNNVFAKRRHRYNEKFVHDIGNDIETMINICKPHVKCTLWAGGIPETFGVVDSFKKDMADKLVSIGRRHAIPTIVIPDKILKRDNILEDGIHLNEAAQRELAEVAYNNLVPCLYQIHLEREPEPNDRLVQFPKNTTKTKSHKTAWAPVAACSQYRRK